MVKQAFRHTWGLSAKEWERCRTLMRDVIVGTAQSRATITYGELSEIVFERRFSARSSALSQMLEEVCTLENEHTGVELGSVVVRADSGIPGKGYFVYVHEHLNPSLDTSNAAGCRRFWQAEVQRVWDIYSASAESTSSPKMTHDD